ncbi:patatin-like phospholipase family protein [Sabulibacter ruber]|uniref:patatin-like phospholipase family protein n=1 Tax=Sabulibacter ruber TaxID=2811901 RepID=UPI001A965C4F|nr:patatin-like phospholipase family protein [Sabulibacter ruber]
MPGNRTTVNAREFTTGNNRIRAILAQLKENIEGKEFSDVVDSQGLQYVDLVMEGSGLQGIVLLGYVYALEEMGIRFLQLGGTSVGAMQALLMAAACHRSEKTSTWILEEIANFDFCQLIDGDSEAKDFLASLAQNRNWYTQLLKTPQLLESIREDFGLNPGNALHQWLKSLLAKKKIDSLKKLKERRKEGVADLHLRNSTRPYKKLKAERLAFIAFEVTTQTKAVFPEMADLYWANPEEVNPADFVRASMSAPLFFEPFRVRQLPFGDKALERWRKVGYYGNVPDEVIMVDGSMMSAFPIDLFHEHGKVPVAPTFGVKPGVDRNSPQVIHKVTDFVSALMGSTRQVHDFDFILRHPDYRQLVQFLPTGGFNWLDFNMSKTDKIRLFEIGVQGAADFLRAFNWKKYKQFRETIAAPTSLPPLPLTPSSN